MKTFLAACTVAMTFAAFGSLIPMPRKMERTGGVCRNDAITIEKKAGVPHEGYELSITSDGIAIRHSDDAGLFYANVTLSQLRETAMEAGENMPCVEIADSPRFGWRGVHLGESQRLFGKATIKRMLDLMSRYKFNVFHWHFVESKGCRIDIPTYPKLARASALAGLCENEKVLFYSARDVKEILDYATARHITIVPEFEFPGHFGAVTAAYPDFKCPVEDKAARNVMCIGNPKAVRFAEKVLDYICELFPGKVVHIGGDECSREPWKKCPRCQAFAKSKGMRDVGELQAWLTRHLAGYLAAKGRRAIGWEEIVMGRGKPNAHLKITYDGPLEQSLLPEKSTMAMGWHHDGGVRTANMGYDVVMCPNWNCYFDYTQQLSDDPFTYFLPKKLFLPFENAYRVDPLRGVKAGNRHHILGGQCCNWTSKTFGRHDLEWKMWPRALATAEVLWSYPDPEKRDFAEFSARAAQHRRRLIQEPVNCAPVK